MLKTAVAVVGVCACLSMSAGTKPQGDESSSLPEAARAAMKNIDAEKIRATVKYLSDDKLEGRGTGQKGGDLAADWLADQFRAYGLQPAGDNGTFFQNVKFFG